MAQPALARGSCFKKPFPLSFKPSLCHRRPQTSSACVGPGEPLPSRNRYLCATFFLCNLCNLCTVRSRLTSACTECSFTKADPHFPTNFLSSCPRPFVQIHHCTRSSPPIRSLKVSNILKTIRPPISAQNIIRPPHYPHHSPVNSRCKRYRR